MLVNIPYMEHMGHYSVVSRSLPALAPGGSRVRGSSLSRLMRLGMDDERWDEVPKSDVLREFLGILRWFSTIEIEIFNIEMVFNIFNEIVLTFQWFNHTVFNHWHRNSLRIVFSFFIMIELLNCWDFQDFLRDSAIWTYEYLNTF